MASDRDTRSEFPDAGDQFADLGRDADPNRVPDTGLWEINSIGEVVHDHQHMLIAVLSDDASEASGISVVEKVATKNADAIRKVS